MYSCPDPTCLKCNKPDQARKRKLIEILRSDANQRARHEQIDKAFEGQESVILMTVNTGQIHLFINWVCSCDRFGIPVRNSTYMVPTDAKAAEVIRKNGFVSLPLDWISELGFTIDSKYEGADNAGWNPHMQGHSDINSVTVIVGNDIIQKGYTLLLHDVDIVWKQDPRGWLKDAAVHRDLLAMFAPRWDALGVANSGFVWLKSNRRTKIFIQTLENLLPIKGISDQQLWNAVIRHYRFRQIGFRVLPLQQFQLLYDHTLRKWDQVGGHAIVVHGVSHRKTYRLAKAKLWFFDETCDAYDRDLIPCNGDYFADHCKI
uniref:Nucleotide-diphospho-sugar transferase domain-containing protein n=1 Tax=Lotharella oceanica TaxID=641309 RepID=A0A7S2XJD3_9EUKA